MSYYAIRDATGVDYCVTIAGSEYEPQFRKHAAWWKRYMHNPPVNVRAKYNKSTSGMPCFPVRIVVEHGEGFSK